MPMVAFDMLSCRSRSEGGAWPAVSNQIGRLGWTMCSRYHKHTSCGKAWSETLRWPRLLGAVQGSDVRSQVWSFVETFM